MSISHRAERVRAELGDLDALLVSDLTNIRWLTGFTGSNGWVVLGHDSLTLVTDGRYGHQAEQQLEAAGVPGQVVVGVNGALVQTIADACAPHGRIGFEAAHVSFQSHGQYAAAISGELAPVVGLVETQRRRKDPQEIEAMARACAIADQALAEVAPMLADGLTEAQVRNLLEIRMRELGASGPSYETIVATGPVNGALPHHRPTETVIEAGHLVVIDVGALVDGYHSDMTRTFVVGEPSAQQRERYQMVLDAQRAGLAAVRAGASAVSAASSSRVWALWAIKSARGSRASGT